MASLILLFQLVQASPDCANLFGCAAGMGQLGLADIQLFRLTQRRHVIG